MALSTTNPNYKLFSSRADASRRPSRMSAQGVRARSAHTSPVWDPELHTLSWRGRIVKHFKSEAPHQEAVLGAFQANNWRASIMLPPAGPAEFLGKESLRNTIRNLNRSVRPYLHFRLEGNGSRVCWEAS
jgi:hypothetical protein